MDKKILLRKIKSEFFKEYFINIKNQLGNKAILLFSTENVKKILEENMLLDKLNIVLSVSSTDELEEVNEKEFDSILYCKFNFVDDKKIFENKFEAKPIYDIFKELLAQEYCFLEEFEKINLDKYIKKLEKKTNGKSVVFYGCGLYFEVINAYYNLKNLNVIAVCDMKFSNEDENQTFLGYKAIGVGNLKALNPDYVFITTQRFVHILENLRYSVLEGTKTKILPFAKISFWQIFKEIWFN